MRIFVDSSKYDGAVMSSLDFKAIIAVAVTFFSLFYLGTFYIEDIDLAPDLLVPKDSFFRGLGQPREAPLGAAPETEAAAVAAATYPGGLEPPFSQYAYTTLLHGIDDRYRYRGFLYNTIILKKILDRSGSKADVIAMIGFTNGDKDPKYDDDINLLKSFGVKIYFLPRMVQTPKVNFAEMALLKISPWSLTQYEAVQYFDADVMPRKSLDAYFRLKVNSFHTGLASPVNSGWFLARPNVKHYHAMWAMAVSRLEWPWNTTTGWGKEIPVNLPYRGGFKYVQDWNFNGASLDQGLITNYFMLTNGDIQMLDAQEVRVYGPGYQVTQRMSLASALSCCGGKAPVNLFAHFTGRNKPWLKAVEDRKGPDVKLWFSVLDTLGLPINSSEASSPLLQTLNSPLGYFHANK